MASERARRKALALREERLPLSDMVTFSLGAFGKDAGNALIGIYYMFFLTQVLSLNAAVVGSVFALTRLFSAFSSPLLGTLIDNTRTRIGKYRPWIMISVIVGAIALLTMFTNISATDATRYLFYLSFYVIWEFAALALDISIWAFLPTITHNSGDRAKVTSLAKIIAGLGNGVITAGTPFFLSFFFINEFEPRGYFFLSIIVSAIMIIGGLLVYLLNRERVRVDSDFIKLKDLFRTLLHNDQLIAYFVSFLLINMAGFLTGNFAVYFFAYDIGNIKYFGLFAILAGIGQGIGIMTYPALSSRIPIRTILIIATLSSVVGYIMMLAIVIIFGATNIMLLCIVSILMLFSGGWIATASQSMLVDITDYGEYKLGNRTASVIFSANSMMWRFISSISIFALGICLNVAGINGVDVESGEVLAVSLKGIWLIRIMMLAVPVLLVIIGLIVFLYKYKLNAREMAFIQDSLAERHILAEEKKALREERKRLSKQLREAKRAYRKDYWSKKFTFSKSDDSRRTKKLSIERTKKRLSLFTKTEENDEFDIKDE